MSTLPPGTVTLLFTDIEGSTRLLQDLGTAYEELLSDHRRLLRSRFEENGGVVVDTQGDAFLVAFGRARDAVVAAVEAQHALAAHDWSGSARPRVRMAIYTGEPSQVDDGFIGLSVHRGARVCAVGHGGQVLLSATARDLVEEHLPSGVALLDLGEHHLKDLDRPETIAQLLIEGIPPVFTPLKKLEGQPVDATPFAGREDELATVAEHAIAAAQREDTGELVRRMAAARALALDWRQFIHMPGHGRFANRLEGLGFSIHSTARIAPRELDADLRGLGKAFVAAARDARSVDGLLRREDKTVLARQLAHHRESAHLEHHLHGADRVAAQISARDRLAEARHQFEKEARRLEPRARAIRARVFDARLDPATLDDLVVEMRSLREATEVLAASFHRAHDLAFTAFAEADTPYRR